jgi:hypothetical protein
MQQRKEGHSTQTVNCSNSHALTVTANLGAQLTRGVQAGYRQDKTIPNAVAYTESALFTL